MFVSHQSTIRNQEAAIRKSISRTVFGRICSYCKQKYMVTEQNWVCRKCSIWVLFILNPVWVGIETSQGKWDIFHCSTTSYKIWFISIKLLVWEVKSSVQKIALCWSKVSAVPDSELKFAVKDHSPQKIQMAFSVCYLRTSSASHVLSLPQLIQFAKNTRPHSGSQYPLPWQ